MSVHVCLSIKHGADIYRPLTSEETPPPRVEVYKTWYFRSLGGNKSAGFSFHPDIDMEDDI